MQPKTFGRRNAGLAAPARQGGGFPAAAAARVHRSAAPDNFATAQAQPAAAPDTLDRSMLGDIPFLTMALVLGLLFIFAAQVSLAFDHKSGGGPGLISLVAQGALSYKLIVQDGQAWRLFLGPLLHSGHAHAFSNCLALFLVGVRLEGQIGRSWLAAIFVLSALGGAAGSLLYNPPEIPSVGASGAICGLVVALFVVSFFGDAGPDERWRMQRMAFFFGGPALLPLFFTSGGNVDYAAHAGGALVGGLVAFLVKSDWFDVGDDEATQSFAAMASAACLAASVASVALASQHVAGFEALAAKFVPSHELPKKLSTTGPRSADLLARYPDDPRAHLVRSVWLMEARRFGEAERRLLKARDIARASTYAKPLVPVAEMVLAQLMLWQGRRREAYEFARGPCRQTRNTAVRKQVHKLKLCNVADVRPTRRRGWR